MCTGAFFRDAAATQGIPIGFGFVRSIKPLAGEEIVAGGEHEFVGDVLGELLILIVTGNSLVDNESPGVVVASMSRSIAHFRL